MFDAALDSLLCLDCEICTAGCARISADVPGVKLEGMGQTKRSLMGGPQGPAPRQCWHCARAVCIETCPAGAMRRDARSGLVYVDRSRCVGCWMCVLACPIGAVLPSRDGRYAVKCDGCLDRGAPACAGTCQARNTLFEPAAPIEAAGLRHIAFAAAGWGSPAPADYPPPRNTPLAVAHLPATTERSGRYVIVGAGIATVQAVEAIRRLDSEGEITIVTEEADGPYSRVLLSHYLAGLRDRPSLALRPASWFTEMGVTFVAADGARALDVDRQRVVLLSGREIAYDRLLVATGASSARLPIAGFDLDGVIGLRNLADAATVMAREPAQVVVVGGGFIGIKVAEAMLQRGAQVVVVEKLAHLLPQMLDARAARMVRERLEDVGIRVILGTGVRQIEGTGRAAGVLLEDGQRLRGGLVAVGAGVTPNIRWLGGSPVVVGRGVVVDEQMRTSVPGVWAAGDVTETRDLLSGVRVVSAIWPAAAAQGRIAGANMAGGLESYEASLPMNTLDVLGLAVASFGHVNGHAAVITADGPAHYVKRVYQDGALVGAVLVGDLREAGRLLAELRRHTAGTSRGMAEP